MKKCYVLFIFLGFQISFLVQGQTIDLDSEWRVNYSRVDVGQWWILYKHNYKDFIDGDTVLNSHSYHKIYHSGFYYEEIQGGPGWYSYYEHSLHGYLREENDKWFIFYNNHDTLLCDFGLEVGDTLRSIAGGFGYIDLDIIVNDIDSIELDGKYVKRFELGYGGFINAAYMIEEIGITTGLFVPIYQFEYSEHMVCYARNGISLWGEPTEECDLAVNLLENDQKQFDCSLVPNPAKDFTSLTIPSGVGEVTMNIIDLSGRIVNEGRYESPSVNRIDLSHYSPGIYLAIIKSYKNTWMQKLIIQ